jgi:uncharacterized membrane protein YbhN (UPF0104 family)
MPEGLSPHRIRRRVLQLALVVVVIGILIVVGPGLGSVRNHLKHASLAWVAAAVASEVLSVLAYVVIFRAVFCPRMSWRLSSQIGMAEQAANSVLSVSGAGGLALGAWALHRGGMSTEYMARRTVAFFVLTSLANVGGVILFAFLYLVGILHHDRDPALTYSFGAAAVLATAAVVALPKVLGLTPPEQQPDKPEGKLRAAAHFVRHELAWGVEDGLVLLRQRSVGVLVGSVGTMVFDLLVLGATFKALGYSPAVGMLVLGYLIGQLGGNIPIPGGIGGLDAGLVGVFALYGLPVAVAASAVLIYHLISLWVPGIIGTVAFLRLRNTLRHAAEPAAMCAPLADPIEVTGLAAVAH